MFIFPIPMVAFSAKYGWKDSLPVFVCTILISFLFGTFTGMFYAVGMSFVGMVYGSCIKSDRDMNRTLILVMILSAAIELLCTVALATFAGFDLNADIMAMQLSHQKAAAAHQLLSVQDLRRHRAGPGLCLCLYHREAFLQRRGPECPSVRRYVRRDLPDLLRLHRPAHGLQCLPSPPQDPGNDHLSFPYHVHILYPYACRLSLYQRQSSQGFG